MSQFKHLISGSSSVVQSYKRCDSLFVLGVHCAHPVWGDASAKVHVGGQTGGREKVHVFLYFVSVFVSFCYVSFCLTSAKFSLKALPQITLR